MKKRIVNACFTAHLVIQFSPTKQNDLHRGYRKGSRQ
ncbi:hypothetical protein Krac_0904 [Ktedonobacter racemifer DSM 44963]|uniref:Uncharacterized protein n=1 Tax=Ktedonobacter racemifer DSM 44963 TaxID=485913 RepID=D6U5Q3_KTERA|nr:hypothetical protein Krac_0904 [Ktedonobacter racemifer DSM 44963]